MKKRINIRVAVYCLVFLTGVVELQAQETQQAQVEKVSNKMFFQALQLYKEMKFWDCARELSILLDFNPGYSQMDHALLMLGNCLYEVNLHEGAERIYKFMLRKHVKSEYLPEAILGIERIHYDRGNYRSCIEYFKILRRSNPAQRILNYAGYYAGLAYYHLGDYPACNETLELANSTSPYYEHTLYTRGVSLLQMKNIEQALEILRVLSEMPPTDDERQSILDETHLTLGYVYYEMGYFKDALSHFRTVSPSSSKHPDALLAAGWTEANQKNWNKAASLLTLLYNNYENSPQTSECLFLLGRCYLKLGKYDNAVEIYEYLIEHHQDLQSSAHRDSLQKELLFEKQRIQKRKMELLSLESKLVKSIYNQSENSYSPFEQRKGNMTSTHFQLFRDIERERKEMNRLEQEIDQLKQQSRPVKSEHNWIAYAEYGITRAKFLKRQTLRHQQ
ncbi:MAG: tetratricopeptide repeat protein [candidate division KSB1 bacterium]|nr:tetratricopeptide repeat protein [candidate division KSB1 bacterium]